MTSRPWTREEKALYVAGKLPVGDHQQLIRLSDGRVFIEDWSEEQVRPPVSENGCHVRARADRNRPDYAGRAAELERMQRELKAAGLTAGSGPGVIPLSDLRESAEVPACGHVWAERKVARYQGDLWPDVVVRCVHCDADRGAVRPGPAVSKRDAHDRLVLLLVMVAAMVLTVGVAVMVHAIAVS